MAFIVDRLVARRLGYSLLDYEAEGTDCIRYQNKSDLARAGKRGPMLLPGVKFGQHNSLFTQNAQVLGLLAKEDGQASGMPTIAVLFRDSDGTRSTPARQWKEKVYSMQRGFALADYACGVPMVPRPKSEAWLIGAFLQPPYAHCAALEDASGNDGSPQSLKNRLKSLVGHVASAHEQAQWVHDGRVEPERIDMPSFTAFRTALESAVDVALHHVP
ncbi:hypothetical protein [Xylophilus ampelinus]|nr:hypothetical protein [Xylophilus ampelinus]MCS4511562.1 hypothetical protein [Xylophilus ampelinus]